MSAINSTDDGSTANAVKVEQENDFHCSSPSRSPSRQNISSKVAISTNLLASSSSANKRLTGTLNRLLHSVVNRPNGHHYHHLNGLSSSPSASSSTATTALPIDSSGKDGKLALEMTTAAIESFVQHFDSSFNTMTYFQEKLQQLLVSIAQERDNYRTLYLKEHDRRLAAELRLKDTHNALA